MPQVFKDAELIFSDPVYKVIGKDLLQALGNLFFRCEIIAALQLNRKRLSASQPVHPGEQLRQLLPDGRRPYDHLLFHAKLASATSILRRLRQTDSAVQSGSPGGDQWGWADLLSNGCGRLSLLLRVWRMVLPKATPRYRDATDA